MTKKQIIDYLKKYSINSKEELAFHIQELKSNTTPNIALISELVYVLEDFSFYFSPEIKADYINYIGRQMKRGKIFNYNTSENNKAIFNLAEKLKKEENQILKFKSLSKFNITGRGEVIIVKSQSDESLVGKIVSIDGELYKVKGVETQGYLRKGSHIGLLISKITEKINKTEKNIMYLDEQLEHLEKNNKNINSTRHKSVSGETHKELPSHNLDYISPYLENLKKIYSGEMNRPETFIIGKKETEGKLFYELDFQFIKQMAERMQSNKENSKYEIWNWKKPMTPKGLENLKQAMWRHIIAVMCGEFEDDGREFGHLEAISNNAMMINYQLNNVK